MKEMEMEEAKKLIETGTIDEIQAAIDNGTLYVNGVIRIDNSIGERLKLPYVCYAMMVGRSNVLEVFLENHADVNMTIKSLGTMDEELNTIITPLDFAVAGYYRLFGKNMEEGVKNAKMLLEHHALPENFGFMLSNMNDHVEEYITLLLDYGAKLDAIESWIGDTVFIAAAGNPNSVVLKTLVEKAKKLLPAKKFLELLRHKGEFGQTIDNSIPFGSQTYDYWEKEGPKLIKELELEVAAKSKKTKKKTKMSEDEAKKLIETGTIEEIQAAIDNHELWVNDSIEIEGDFDMVAKLPHICYAMVVGRPDVVKVFLDNNADVNINMSGWLVHASPLRFAVGACYRHSKFYLPESFNFMLKNMDKYAKEYITLLSDYGADFANIEGYNTIFMEAAGNPNPVVLETTIKEAKKRLPAKKFLELLGYHYSDTPQTENNLDLIVQDTNPNEEVRAYWKKEGPKLIKKLKLKAAAETKKAKKKTLKEASKSVQEKTKKVTEKVALYAKKQKQND